MAEEPITTITNTQCATTEGSTNGVVVGGSTQTCVTTHEDGSRTVTETTCGKMGASGSIGVASGSATYSNCTTATTTYPAKPSSSASSGNSSCTTKTRGGQQVTSCKQEVYPSKTRIIGR